MNRTRIAILLVIVGVAVQASPQPKLGLLNLSLTHRHAALGTNSSTYGVVNANTGKFDTNSFDTLADPACQGNIVYRTELLPNITTAKLITALNAGLQGANRSGGFFPLRTSGYDAEGNGLSFKGSFTPNAKLVLVDYDDRFSAPPYVGARRGSVGFHRPFFNAPWYYDVNATLPQNGNGYPNIPVAGELANSETGFNIFSWPNLTQLAWGRLPWDWSSLYPPKAVARVMVMDPNNANANLRCFDVTPFFTFEEASCQFCYDTDGRVTDGNIHTYCDYGPCPVCGGPPVVSYVGSGLTKFYLTIKFNNSQNNPLPAIYYNSALYRQDDYYGVVGKKLSWTDLGWPTTNGGSWDFGSYLSEENARLSNDTTPSKDSLIFSVGGIVEYPWVYVNSVSKGTMTMPYAEGFGQNPFCGVFRGQVTITESTTNSLSCYNNFTGFQSR